MVYVVKNLLLPPASLLLIALFAAVLRWLWPRWRPRLLGVILCLALSLLTALSLPVVAGALARRLEARFPALPKTGPVPGEAQAIVVLGSGLYYQPPEYVADSPTGTVLERLRYAALLAERTGLPLLVTGGSVFARGEAEGQIMRRVLEAEWRVPVRWVESESRNTAENAEHSAELLKAEGIKRVLLVTHALHIPRAMACFEHAGLTPIAAPTRFVSAGQASPSVLDFIPSASALGLSSQALHEYLGLFWYRLRYGVSSTGP